MMQLLALLGVVGMLPSWLVTLLPIVDEYGPLAETIINAVVLALKNLDSQNVSQADAAAAVTKAVNSVINSGPFAPNVPR